MSANWHDLTPREQVLAMVSAEMDRLDERFGRIEPHDDHPADVALLLTNAADLLRDVQACAEYDRTRKRTPNPERTQP